MYTVPEQLSELAGACLSASQEVQDAWSAASGPLTLASGSAGDTAGGAALLAAHTEAAEAADLLVGRYVGVLEQDMDDLYATAFDMTTTDEAAAATYRAPVAAPRGPGRRAL